MLYTILSVPMCRNSDEFYRLARNVTINLLQKYPLMKLHPPKNDKRPNQFLNCFTFVLLRPVLIEQQGGLSDNTFIIPLPF